MMIDDSLIVGCFCFLEYSCIVVDFIFMSKIHIR
jgi:hypothetical protein